MVSSLGVMVAGVAMRMKEEEDEVVVVGGGVMGLASAYALARERKERTLVDANHAGVRGSWGSSRASHLSMEDELLLEMNLLAMNEWDKLDDDTEDPIRTSIGRIFAGPLGSYSLYR